MPEPYEQGFIDLQPELLEHEFTYVALRIKREQPNVPTELYTLLGQVAYQLYELKENEL